MGFIKGGLLGLACILLFISILLGNVFATLFLSLDYDVIEPELISVVSGITGEYMNLEDIENDFYLLEGNCENNSEYVFKDRKSGYTFVIPCEVIAQGPDAVIENQVQNLVNKAYYDNYDCKFWDCVSEKPFFLVSEKARNYWKSKFYFVLISFLILISIIFFLVEKKENTLILTGILAIVSALPFLKIDLFSFLFKFNNYAAQMFSVFFSKAMFVSLVVFILGIFILGAGFGIKFWGWGTFLHRKVSGDKKQDSSLVTKKKEDLSSENKK